MSASGDTIIPGQHDAFLMEFDRRYAEVSELAKKCMMQVGKDGRATLMLICLLVDRDHETYPGGSSIHIARAFLNTQGLRDATMTDYNTVFSRGGGIASWFEGDVYRCICLRDLIAQFYGETFMHDEYVMRFGPIDDDEIEDEPAEPWEQNEPEIESEPSANQEPYSEPDVEDST